MRNIGQMAFLLLLSMWVPISGNLFPSAAADKPTTTAVDWQRLAVKDEEFSVLTPVQPSLMTHSDGYTLSEGGEKVLKYRAYSGYAEDFIFIIESYQAAKPQRLLKDVERMFSNSTGVPLEGFEKDSFGRFQGKKYSGNGDRIKGYNYVFVTARHVYRLKLAARDANHPSFKRFLSSLTLGDISGVVGSVWPRSEDDSISTEDFATANSGKEVTTKALVIWKPEPGYTESARKNQTHGTVVLKAIFTSSGQVIVSSVSEGLADGLTEKAIKAAKNIRFFPAEKDGNLVSQRIQLEYSFNLY